MSADNIFQSNCYESLTISQSQLNQITPIKLHTWVAKNSEVL